MTEFITLTTDEWTSRSTKGYMAITAHFLDSQMILRSRVLETRRITASTTAENISSELKSVMSCWNIEEKVHAVVIDNVANMKAAIRILGKNHVPCFAHTLNLCVETAIDRIEQLTAVRVKIRNIVSFFHRSVKATNSFESEQKIEIQNDEHFTQQENLGKYSP